MQCVVEAQAPDIPDILQRKGRQEEPDVRHLVGHLVFAIDVPLDDAGLLRLGQVCYALRQDGVAVVGLAVFGEESHKSLRRLMMGVSFSL